MKSAPFTVTLKAGSGHDAPWVIVKAETPELLLGRLRALEQHYAAQAVSRLSLDFQGAYAYEGKHRAQGSR